MNILSGNLLYVTATMIIISDMESEKDERKTSINKSKKIKQGEFLKMENVTTKKESMTVMTAHLTCVRLMHKRKCDY